MYYARIVADLAEIPNFIAHYERELDKYKQDVQIRGNISKQVAELPGLTEQIFSELQEIEAVLNYMNIQLRKIKQKYFKQYLEGYARALTSRDAERYSDSEDEVTDYECIQNEVALIRNKYLSIMKSLESKNFMLGHLVRLKSAGMEDFSL